MRLIRLELAGIGPFLKPQVIDFADLEDSGLFLLEGPTGSGKTTLLDAIAFALYGKVTGDKTSSASRLRSRFCGDHDESYVSLDFEHGGKHYRVRRSPSYAISRRKTPVNAKATLLQISAGAETAISARVDQTAMHLQQILPLSFDDFTQIMILPQGKFQTFLLASPSERGPLLEKIFRTALFTEVTTLLKAKHKAIQEQITATANQVKWASQQLMPQLVELQKLTADPLDPANTANAAGLTGPLVEDFALLEDLAETPPPVSPAQLRSRFKAVLGAARKDFDSLQLDGKRWQQQRLDLELQRDRLRDALRLSREIAQAQEEERENEKQAPLAQQNRERLETAALVEPAAQKAELVQQLQEEFAQSEREWKQAKAAWQSFSAKQNAADPEKQQQISGVELIAAAQKLAQQLEGIKTEVGRLNTEIAQIKGRSKSLKQDAEHSEKEIAKLDKELEGAAASLATAETLKQEAQAAAQSLALTKRDLEQAEKEAEAHQRSAKLESQLEALNQRLQSAINATAKAKVADTKISAAWLASGAARIAQNLEEDQPCPVCGSLEHPQPAAAAGDESVSDEDVRQTREALEQAQRKENELRNQRESLESELRTWRQQLQIKDSVQAKAQFDELKVLFADLEAIAESLPERNQKCEELKKLLGRLSENKEKVTQKLRASTGAAKEITAQHNKLQKQLEKISAEPNAAQYYADVAQEAEDLNHALQHSYSKRKQTKNRHERAQIELKEALEAAKLTPEDNLGRLRMSAAERDAAIQQIKTYELRRAELKKKLSQAVDQNLADSPEDFKQRLNEAEEYLQGAIEKCARIDKAVGAQESKLTVAEKSAAGLEREFQKLCDLREAEEPFAFVSDLANNKGQSNLLGITLPDYVLRVRLQQIVAQAGPILLKMTGGTYEIAQVDSQHDQHGNSHRGLGIEIVDHRTDSRRDPKSLSGGEIFCASLALSLALMRTICTERGAIDIQTMFIDEGFGTLDETVLADVLNQLMNLTRDGTTVGVISHVPQLKEAIRTQVKVRRNPRTGYSQLKIES